MAAARKKRLFRSTTRLTAAFDFLSTSFINCLDSDSQKNVTQRLKTDQQTLFLNHSDKTDSCCVQTITRTEPKSQTLMLLQNRGEPSQEPATKMSPRTRGGLTLEEAKDDGKKVRPRWTGFRSKVMIQLSERDKPGSMREFTDEGIRTQRNIWLIHH